MTFTSRAPLNPEQCTPILPRNGIVTLYGYGIKVYVDRGHLILDDGIGMNRRHGRFPRVRHGLKRLVVIGSNGMVTFEALRWLAADQDAAFVMLDRDGSVLTVSGPVGPSDARLRRAQSLAHQSGLAVQISREIICQKLDGQERVVRDFSVDNTIADSIATARKSLHQASSVKEIRNIEALGAQGYWSAWRNLPINFPTADLHRVPEHWRTFGTRSSPLTGSPRLAVNPANAMLNYLYALLETESRLAAAALGLDPGIGLLHVDTDARDSLACDIMEPARPLIDAFVLNWIAKESLKREWFFENRDGSCRLMAKLAEMLTETSSAWRHCVAPIAEQISRMLWSTIRNNGRFVLPPTYLTQSSRRYAKGKPKIRIVLPQRPPHICVTCGRKVTREHCYCSRCKVAITSKAMIEAARKGRLLSHTSRAESKRAKSRRLHFAAQKNWDPSAQPDWLTESTYRERIQPLLSTLTISTIRTALEVSKGYATNIRSGKRTPHPRHWKALSELTVLL
jgi:CRISPR-associated endonuclease Cas1